MMKKEGISLAALVLTIVVLIISSLIVISSMLGENGIISRAKQAVFEKKIVDVREQLQLSKRYKYNTGAIDIKKR